MTAASRRVILVRHGRSAHAPIGWLDADGLRRWFEAYDLAGIVDDDAPPPPLRAVVASAGLVVASDLPRAVASAERLVAPGAAVATSPLLRETPLPIPALGRLRLPLGAWALAFGAGMAYRRLRRVPHPAAVVAQVTGAAEWLAGLAARHGAVVAVTHSNVRGLLAGRLVATGWRREPGGGRFAHWSAWSFSPPT